MTHELEARPAEHAIWLDGSGGPLLAFVTERRGNGPGFLVAPGAGRAGLTKSDSLFIRMARAIADADRDVVRFDWRGTGNSLGKAHFRDDPVYVDDVITATSVFDEGRPLALLGSCYGARAVLRAATELDNTVSVALLAYPMPGKAKNRELKAKRISLARAARLAVKPSVIKGWFDPRMRMLYRRWISNRLRLLSRRTVGRSSNEKAKDQTEPDTMDHLVESLSTLVERGVSVLFVFGEGEQHLELFRAAAEDELATVIAASGGQIEVVTTSEGLYGWRTVSTVNRALDIAREWALRVDRRREWDVEHELEVERYS